jgi:hypothetical protein
LLTPSFWRDRSDHELTSSLLVENAGENAGRIKPRQAEPVDRAIEADQGCGVQVSDNSIARNRFVWHELNFHIASETVFRNSGLPLGKAKMGKKQPAREK